MHAYPSRPHADDKLMAKQQQQQQRYTADNKAKRFPMYCKPYGKITFGV